VNRPLSVKTVGTRVGQMYLLPTDLTNPLIVLRMWAKKIPAAYAAGERWDGGGNLHTDKNIHEFVEFIQDIVVVFLQYLYLLQSRPDDTLFDLCVRKHKEWTSHDILKSFAPGKSSASESQVRALQTSLNR